MSQELDLSEVKVLLEQRVAEAEKRLQKSLSEHSSRSSLSLAPFEKRLGAVEKQLRAVLQDSHSHTDDAGHTHSAYVTKGTNNENLARLVARVERLERGDES